MINSWRCFCFSLAVLGSLVSSTFGEEVKTEEKKGPVELEKVIVTATKTEHKPEEVPAAVEVITKEELEQREVYTVQDVLKYLPGIMVRESSGSWGNKGNVEILGMDAKYTLVLIDGQRFVGGHGGTIDIQSISTQMVERIEVVKGPASALYGSDAVGGVINIITKKPEKPYVSMGFTGGSSDTQVYEGEGGVKYKNFSGLVAYTYRHTNGVDKRTDEFHESILFTRFDWEVNPKLKITVRPYYSWQKMVYQNRNQGRTAINANIEWKPDKVSRFNLRGSIFDYKHYTEDRKTNWDTDNYEIEATYSRFLFDKILLTAGYHYYREEIDDKGKKYEADQYLHSFYLQGEANFSPLTIVVGARLDDHDRWGTEINPKLNIMYKITENLKLKGTVGRAFKAPDLVRLYGEGWRMGPYIVHANPNLKPEKSVGYQLGIEYKFLNHFVVDTLLFRNEVKDLITPDIVRGRRPPFHMYWINRGRAIVEGAEISLSGYLTKTSNFRLGYTYLYSEDKKTGAELPYKPKHRISLVFNQYIPSLGMNINFAGEYVGKRYDSDNRKLPDYSIWDIALTKFINKNFQAFVRLENIFNEKHVEDQYDIDGRKIFAGIKVNF